MERQTKKGQWGMRAGKALALAASVGVLSACDDLLEVEIPHLLTGDAIAGPSSAGTQLNSAIALFECGTSAFAWVALGHEDMMEAIAGVAGTVHVWRASPVTGTCDLGSATQNWFDQMMGARSFLAGIDPSTREPSGVYTRLVNDWDATLVPDREEIMAIGALYMAASLTHFGEFYCEGALDIGPVMGPSNFLTMADAWVDSAIIHLNNLPGDDVELPNDIADSGADLALALRARIRMSNGNIAGAAAAAQAVLASDNRFEALITRSAGLQRRNKIYHAANAAGFSAGLGVINWWNNATGQNRTANPVPIVGTTPAAGNRWPNPIPFTGYIALGIGPNGETLTQLATRNIPVRWAAETRDAAGNFNPAGNNLAGAVADTRVPTIFKSIQGPNPAEVPAKYASDSDPIPWITWRELTLYIAEWENTTNNNRANAIARINQLRTFHGLPIIQGAFQATLTDGTNDQLEMRLVILEEYRRELHAEGGRYWAVKIRNTDALWFPRRQGSTPTQAYNIQGGVRLHFPNDEYTVNPNFTGLTQRGTVCALAERTLP